MKLRAPDWMLELSTPEKDDLEEALELVSDFYGMHKPKHDVENDDEAATLRAFEALERLASIIKR